MTYENKALKAQASRNQQLLDASKYTGDSFSSSVLPFRLEPDNQDALTPRQALQLEALQRQAARTAIHAVAELAKLNEVDHLGGGLDLIPSLLMTLAMTDYQAVEYTIENAHASIGYYGALSALGFLEPDHVAAKFRQSLDIAGHVAWVPGGTQLNGGRLGVMVPVAVGQALGKRARYGDDAWILCHCGDAGWVSGQALNGFNAADLHRAPITFVMQRNGIQLSGSNQHIMDKDPRKMVEAMGITILEIDSLHDAADLFRAYREARLLARRGRPSMIYPVGYHHVGPRPETLTTFAVRYGIVDEVTAFAARNQVAMDTGIWTPGALMSFRDVEAMLECLFLVNRLPGGKGHHDGHLKGRDVAAILANPMLMETDAHREVLAELSQAKPRTVITLARPAPGTPNVLLDDQAVAEVKLPAPGEEVSARAGVQPAYALIAKNHPGKVFVVSCDLDPSTKLDKAAALAGPGHHFEMSIQEQASALLANGIAMAGEGPRFVVFSTFAAFFEGIAREAMELWRYQRNLNGINEGLNVTFHMSHVGACTGRDHFSGWSLDWISMAMGYLPYLHRFYAPADARAAFVAIRDAAAHYGGHLIGIPRDNLPILTKQGVNEPLWQAGDAWESVTPYRKYEGAARAILALGAPAHLAGKAADELYKRGQPTDVYIINGLPIDPEHLCRFFSKYPDGLVTVEDGLIGNRSVGLRGFAGLIAANAGGMRVPVAHVGIVDPRIAPSEGHYEVWEHFGITQGAIVAAVESL
ncbi:MAG TPA: thiamine pyrophosphate-dependent enzyme [Kiritimatiellia bacterium]|nr:thiamine pyrophosphate-dependent enzyme [Kiritimatiellia bacterium]HMP00349.1 thiamine pyrophosphate-dependent enzyme [Kiritimatiellia bacterium]HMP96032.1 thiamine pyrophosphate-dependent enzyme [Kiritimatiellia bacterium]